ncbi:antibiotic biosynthesis monooxygenase family protein [Shewanella pneumatophori]|uniref:Antibiotic biosynthesis monooxygenase n=1 Tax=Shewanella pneumatophori TaxID=314092 RepID=A0A9X2CF41_9GAMM|nr:antibiotic biosynthesis monooxygenase [Shewanella pneumatophori]MCL1137371.1 antibiotic biosynthesis monooxygenase [Shewanella pneumatophori]
MSLIANTPTPPYYYVVFTSEMAENIEGYAAMGQTMAKLAHEQEGFLGMESAREQIGITVSYWRTLADIKAWRLNAEHMEAQRLGREKWYSSFTLRIAKVEREYCLTRTVYD